MVCFIVFICLQEGASEDSPLLAKQCGIETADSSNERKTFTISLYKEVFGLVFNRIHWLVLAFSMLFFMLAGATLSSFFILFEKLAEVCEKWEIIVRLVVYCNCEISNYNCLKNLKMLTCMSS